VLPEGVPGFEDTTVFGGVVHTENPLRGAYLREPLELMYDPVTWMRFDVPPGVTEGGSAATPVRMTLPLKELNGPIREVCFFLRRKAVWRYNEWTNYGTRLEEGLVTGTGVGRPQKPMLVRAQLMVGNAIIRDEEESWWRYEYGLAHRGGVRLSGGMVYGFVFGEAGGWSAEDFQPVGTVNASRAEIRLDLWVQPPADASGGCPGDGTGWEVFVFGVGVNWLRVMEGLAAPLFKD
jgi:hypothetical protein